MAAATDVDQGDSDSGGGGGGGTLHLRLIAMGVIALVSLLGCSLPALIYYMHHGHKAPTERLHVFSLLKCFAAGIILGVGLVHVLPDAHDMMSAAAPGYPWAFAMALFGVLLIVAVNQGMELLFRRVYGLGFDSQEQHDHDHWEQEEEGRILRQGNGGGPARPPQLPGSYHLHHNHEHGDEKIEAAHPHDNKSSYSSVHLPYYSARYGSLGHAPPRVSSIFPNDPPAAAVRRSASCYDYHQSLLAPVAEEADAPTPGARHCHHHEETRHIVAAFQSEGRSVLTATMMEIGIVFHSILIGIGLGVVTTDRSAVLGLLIAISAHQFFEGMGLATVILEAAAALPKRRIALLFLVFSLTTPLGVGIGILIASSPSTGESKSALLLEGGLNGLASGVLLTLGLQDMLVSELHQRKAQGSPGLQAAMLLSALGGALAMDAMAMWA